MSLRIVTRAATSASARVVLLSPIHKPLWGMVSSCPTRFNTGYARWGDEQPPSVIAPQWVTTGPGFPGCEVEASLGLVRGVVVRSRNVFTDFFGQIQEMFGGNIGIYAAMCEKAREDATRLMMNGAAALGANAVIAVRYQSSEIHHSTEVLCYGTAVRLVSAGGPGRRRP